MKRCGLLTVILVILTGCAKNNNQNAEKEIIEKEKLILNEWGKGHTMIFPNTSADEITYFDPSLEKRLNGKNEFIMLLKPIENKFTIEKYEMLDPKVQLYGDVAVLTYNLVDYAINVEGDVQKSLWNTTEVYKKTEGKWMIIHSHWSITKPLLH